MADIPPPPPGPPQTPPAYQPPPAYAPPPGYQLPQGYQQQPMQPGMAPPPGSPGYMPQPIAPAGGINLGAQIAGAGYSIGVGVVGIVVPFVSAFLLGGTIFYFYALPIFGVIYGVRSIMRGYMVGGLIGVGLNILAGIVSLMASGIVHPGS